MKKLISIALAIMLIASLCTVAFAADPTGSITINGVSTGNTYSIYKILDLESYDATSKAYSYKVNADWTTFFETEEALKYVAIDEAGYVTWIAGEDDDTVAAFAKAALAFAQANGIDPVQSSENDGEFVITTGADGKSSGKFSNLSLGYYLVDSTMGALCGLTTTNPDASINANNSAPTIDKQVREDSTEQWGDKNTADVGQYVEFRTTINVHAGAQNFVLHDKMGAGLTFEQNEEKKPFANIAGKEDIFAGVWRVERVIPGVETRVVPAEKYQILTDNLGDDCTFHVVFTQAFCDELETNDKVVVYYTAMVNRHAIVAEDGNPNEATLDFGEGHHTTTDKTQTFTYGIDIVKTDSQNTLINGAQFKIYDAAVGGNEIAVVLMDDGVTYRRARADENGVSIEVKNGKVRVVGFDNGTYYLEETVAPAGYNKLTARQKFIISDANLDATFNGDIYSTGSGVHVVNKTGSMLPETGGLGTLLFTLLGGSTVLGTGVVLVTKKRMSKIEDEE